MRAASALRAGFGEGKITAAVAEAAARLPEAQQQTLARRLEDAPRLSLAEIGDVAREQTAAGSSKRLRFSQILCSCRRPSN